MNSREQERSDGMQRSRFSSLLLRMYGTSRLRRGVLRYCMKHEGKQFFSATLRDIQRKYHGVEIGAYSYGDCFRSDHFPAG
ncbi:MAG: hypothetical protein ACR2GY_07565, partial [Phycisphaerales bacterium]